MPYYSSVLHTPLKVDLARAMAALDLDVRLRSIPPTAQMRGIFFQFLRDEVDRRRLRGIPRLDQIIGETRRSYALYPVAPLIEASALAGALIHPDPREGLRQLFANIATYAASTWYGKVFSRYLTPDPSSAFRWLERSREYLCNYGQWRLELRGNGQAIIHMFDEYFWEDVLRGACEGMLSVCGVRGVVECEKESMYRLRLMVHWDDR